MIGVIKVRKSFTQDGFVNKYTGFVNKYKSLVGEDIKQINYGCPGYTIHIPLKLSGATIQCL